MKIIRLTEKIRPDKPKPSASTFNVHARPVLNGSVHTH